MTMKRKQYISPMTMVYKAHVRDILAGSPINKATDEFYQEEYEKILSDYTDGSGGIWAD